MKSKYAFAKKDEIILGMLAMIIVGGLIYQGLFSLWHGKIHAVFRQTRKHR